MIFAMLLEGEPVKVCWITECDEVGSYDSYIDSVMYKGIDVAPILSEDVLNELDAEGHKLFREQFYD